jgi:hypothetical protein
MVRDLAEATATTATTEEEAVIIPKWQPIYTILILILMFSVLITDKVGTDSVMLTALMCFYISGIIDINETLKGFNSSGLLTVLVLFVVAEGLNKTGALNWYVGKLFGRPTTLTGAQLRIMIPITLLSGFINDTPLVTIGLPIVIQWSKTINLSTRFLLMPLSFAALLGGVSSESVLAYICIIYFVEVNVMLFLFDLVVIFLWSHTGSFGGDAFKIIFSICFNTPCYNRPAQLSEHRPISSLLVY